MVRTGQRFLLKSPQEQENKSEKDILINLIQILTLRNSIKKKTI